MNGPASAYPLGVPPGSDPFPPAAAEPSGVQLKTAVVDAVIVFGWFAVLGVLGGVLWEAVTPLAAFTRVGDDGIMGEQELARQFSASGWYVVIGVVGGLISGFALVLWRRRNPVLMVVLLTLGGALAAFVMAQVGLALGPEDPQQVLPTVDVGDKVPLQLAVEGFGIYFTWAIAALASACAVLFGMAVLAALEAESQHGMQGRDGFPRFELPRNG